MESYSQCGQDIFVINLLKDIKGTFLDLGCNQPLKINNTYLLELHGWTGVSVDINDYSKNWEVRKNLFIQKNAFQIEFNSFLSEYYENKVIDYLTLDMENVGDRFKLLDKVIDSDFKFKIITVEHDSYLGRTFYDMECVPQRNLLKNKGYHLLCSDVANIHSKNSFYEDWWVNPEYFDLNQISHWQSDKESCDSIFKKVGIDYKINEISNKW